ncbi:MAG: hypothetical protein K6E10_06830 [Eubacterium sp.]|nr:hypothetical protein [Eubacterium sp.]
MMTSVMNVSGNILGPILGLVMIIFWLQTAVYVLYSKIGMSKTKHILNIFFLIFEYMYFEIVMCMRFYYDNPKWALKLVNALPFFIFILNVVVMAAFLIFTYMDYLKYKSTRLNNMSIKESIDILPEGLFVYTAEGLPLLINPMMERIIDNFFKMKAVNGVGLEKMIEERIGNKLTEEGHIIKLGEGNIYMVRKHIIYIENKECHEMILNDVNDIYEVNSQLEEENSKLVDMNRRLEELNKMIDEVTINSEILDAKVSVHDYLGQVLIATKHYLVEGEGSEEKSEKLLDMWKENTSFFRNARVEEKKDEFIQLMNTANDVGVTFQIEGRIPSIQPQRHIFVTAIHECMTNTIRHAKGDMLFINVNDSKISIKNNGEQPSKRIVETGGLASLRRLVEKQGGEMYLHSDGEFELEVKL